MRVIKIVVRNSNHNLDVLAQIPFNKSTSWVQYELLNWARNALSDGERPKDLEFTDNLEMVEANLKDLYRIGYSRILKEDINKH